MDLLSLVFLSLPQSFSEGNRRSSNRRHPVEELISLFLERKEAVGEIFKFFPRWVSRYEINGVSNSGEADLLHDWGVTQLNSIFPVRDRTVIEMAPQEAAHTIMLHNFGAKRIVALEGRLENYIKCCVIKNIFGLHNCSFYLEDLRNVDLKKFGSFDVCLCSGILYHLSQPQELLAKIAGISPRILINTHYARKEFPIGCREVSEVELKGHRYRGKIHDEGDISHPSAGLQPFSFWFFKKDLIRLLADLGYSNIRVLMDWMPKTKVPGLTIYAEMSTTANQNEGTR